MATVTTTISSLLFGMLLPSLFLPTCGLTNAKTQAHFSKPAHMKLRQKVSHLHFFFHDVVSGRNATAMPVTDPVMPLPSSFGKTVMMDDLLTEGPEPTSKPVGRAQGMYAFAAQQELGLLMVMNLVFTEGKYNGSVLTVLGRNPVLHRVREMPVVGGSGLFRFARGYAQAQTHWFNPNTGDAIVEYNAYVLHY
ncbi:dirigent protein 22-like [Phoenix dactylifera]|uniref:Dirigent protein n=1 Tax=Phoenix dactylifera TaxID=42345 RepID=A0A8B7C0T5_PHODC|nr:dirigent protein 22-like [Phoenix dactylifera]